MNQIVMLLSAVIVMCVEVIATAASMPAILCMALSRADTLRVLDAIEIVSIHDRKLAKSLSKMPDLQSFQMLVDRFVAQDSARWRLMQERMEYCRKMGYSLLDQDVRVRMVLERGPWASEWIEPMLCNTDTCLTWIYTYKGSAEYPQGVTILCEGSPGARTPMRITTQPSVRAKPAGSIYPFVTPALLPSWGTESHQVSVGVTIPADQLTQPTLEEGVLNLQLRVSRRVGNRPEQFTIVDAVTTNIEPLRALLARSEEAQWHTRGAQGYLECVLAPGDYKLAIDVLGAQNNAGTVMIDFSVPKTPVLSDIVLLRNVSGAGFDAGVQRGNESFYSISRPEFVAGTTISIRLEFLIPKEFHEQYNAWITLVPIPEIHQRASAAVSSDLQVLYWEDEDGNPKYGSQLPVELLQPAKRDRGAITLLDRLYTAVGDIATLTEEVTLFARPGKYVLSIQISESRKRESPLGLKSMVLKILPG